MITMLGKFSFRCLGPGTLTGQDCFICILQDYSVRAQKLVFLNITFSVPQSIDVMNIEICHNFRCSQLKFLSVKHEMLIKYILFSS